MGQKEVPEGAEQAVPPLTPELHMSAPESRTLGTTHTQWWTGAVRTQLQRIPRAV